MSPAALHDDSHRLLATTRTSTIAAMARAPRQRRRIRLPNHAYGVVGTICSVTIGVRARANVLADPKVASACLVVLKERARVTGMLVFGFCVMPDHVHLVLGPSSSCDVVTFVGEFKNLAQRAAWQEGVVGAFWQPGFWDRFVRREEEVESVVNYVLNNPVRGGLVERWQDYPFCGSLVFEL